MASLQYPDKQFAGTKRAIAHRGASAYAPEHTLASYRLAIAQGADYVEQDLAVTRDAVLICLHDDSLERTTNVEELYPDRAVVDAAGRRRWLAVDFTLAEIKRLDAGSWFDARFTGERVPTWEEAIDLVGFDAGLYPELKSPSFYRERGIDIVGLFRTSLKRLRRAPAPESLVVQSFNARALRELAGTLSHVWRTFLIEVSDGARRLNPTGLEEISRFATGIGPHKSLVEGYPEVVASAHHAGLSVTPYTFTSRAPAGRFPDVGDEMRHYLFDLGVDALFTDNPDRFPRRP